MKKSYVSIYEKIVSCDDKLNILVQKLTKIPKESQNKINNYIVRSLKKKYSDDFKFILQSNDIIIKDNFKKTFKIRLLKLQEKDVFNFHFNVPQFSTSSFEEINSFLKISEIIKYLRKNEERFSKYALDIFLKSQKEYKSCLEKKSIIEKEKFNLWRSYEKLAIPVYIEKLKKGINIKEKVFYLDTNNDGKPIFLKNLKLEEFDGKNYKLKTIDREGYIYNKTFNHLELFVERKIIDCLPVFEKVKGFNFKAERLSSSLPKGYKHPSKILYFNMGEF